MAENSPHDCLDDLEAWDSDTSLEVASYVEHPPSAMPPKEYPDWTQVEEDERWEEREGYSYQRNFVRRNPPEQIPSDEEQSDEENTERPDSPDEVPGPVNQPQFPCVDGIILRDRKILKARRSLTGNLKRAAAPELKKDVPETKRDTHQHAEIEGKNAAETEDMVWQQRRSPEEHALAELTPWCPSPVETHRGSDSEYSETQMKEESPKEQPEENCDCRKYLLSGSSQKPGGRKTADASTQTTGPGSEQQLEEEREIMAAKVLHGMLHVEFIRKHPSEIEDERMEYDEENPLQIRPDEQELDNNTGNIAQGSPSRSEELSYLLEDLLKQGELENANLGPFEPISEEEKQRRRRCDEIVRELEEIDFEFGEAESAKEDWDKECPI